MNSNSKYFFTFWKGFKDPYTKKELDSYWIELVGADTKAEARDIMCKLYGGGFRQYSEKYFNPDLHINGCYKQIHLPLPEDIHISSDDPFLNASKRPRKINSWRKKKESKFDKATKFHHVTLKDIAMNTGVSLPTLLNLKNGKKIRSCCLKDIADYLDVSPNDLI